MHKFLFIEGPPRVFFGFREKGYLFSGIWGEGLFIFRDLGRKVIYFQGFGEKDHLFSGIWGESIILGVLGNREQGAEEKHFRELGRKVMFLSWSREQRSPRGGGGLIIAYLPLCI